MIVNKQESRLVFTYGPKGTEYVHHSVMDAYIKREDKKVLKPAQAEETKR
jgi:hypothetical protein